MITASPVFIVFAYIIVVELKSQINLPRSFLALRNDLRKTKAQTNETSPIYLAYISGAMTSTIRRDLQSARD